MHEAMKLLIEFTGQFRLESRLRRKKKTMNFKTAAEEDVPKQKSGFI